MNGIITVCEYSSLQSLPTHYQQNDLRNLRGENETTRLKNIVQRLWFWTTRIFGFIVTVCSWLVCVLYKMERERETPACNTAGLVYLWSSTEVHALGCVLISGSWRDGSSTAESWWDRLVFIPERTAVLESWVGEKVPMDGIAIKISAWGERIQLWEKDGAFGTDVRGILPDLN